MLVNQRTAYIIRFAGFLIPVVLTLYGIMIQIGAVYAEHYSGDAIFYTITAGWLALGIYQFLSVSQSRLNSALRLIGYHIFTVAYILFVAGYSMPFISAWAVLFLASYAYFSRDGLRLSIFVFFAAAVADVLMHLEDTSYVLSNMLAMVATFIVGIVAVAISQAQEVDRSELTRSRAEEVLQRERMLTLINNLADAIMSTDRDGNIQLYNAATLGLLDTNEDLIGKRIDDVIKLIDKEQKPFRLGRSFKHTHSVQARDDLSAVISSETFHLSVIYSPIRGTDSTHTDDEDGYIVILRDITKQKSLEEERDEFISVVSHELRTPITVAEGTLSNAQIMMSRDDIPKSTLTESVTMAHDQVIFLAKMVNDLSTLSRAERGVADEAEEIDVEAMAHSLFAEYEPEAAKKGLTLDLDLSPKVGSVFASSLYLRELLQNFITNSIKYTKEGSVTIIISKPRSDIISFSVKDTGIGISKSDQSRIFDKFYRAEDYRTRETSGTGLGLYVAVKLAKKLGTHITMKSRLNHGSTFGFELPVHVAKDK